MKPQLALAAGLLIGFGAIAQPSSDPEERKAQCVAEVTEKSAAAGEPAKDPGAVCDCLSAGMSENEALRKEFIKAQGLPSPDEASDEMSALINRCKGAVSES